MKFDIDLFASRLNARVYPYASWIPDPNAKFVRAFAANWKSFYILCFSSFQPCFEDSAQSENGTSNRCSCLSNLAHTSMVSSVDEDASENYSGSSPRLSGTSFQTNPQTQAEQVIEANGMSFIRQFYISKGFSSKAVDIMCSSWRTGTKDNFEPISKNGYISVINGKVNQCNFMKW